jgi:hypothetical protein
VITGWIVEENANAAERAENRSNQRVAREYEIALPHELTKTRTGDRALA